MEFVVCVICLLCCLCYGYSAPSDEGNVTLVLSNTPCENNNSYDIPFKFETVSYDEVSDLENQILTLLNKYDSVRLADYGVIRHNSLKCQKLTETPENKKRVSEIKNSIQLANEGQELSYENVLKQKSAFIGYLPSMCVYVPLMASDINCFKEVEGSQCSRNRSTDIALESSEIYLYMIASDFGHDIQSFHMLCSYIVPFYNRRYDFRSFETEIRYSRCDLHNDGALCLYGTSKENKESCISKAASILIIHGFPVDACYLIKRPGCWYQVCADNYIDIEERVAQGYIRMRRLPGWVYYTDRKKIILLDVYKTPNNNTKCISLTREMNRLFVHTTTCDRPMNFICKKIPSNHTVPDTTMNTILKIDNEGPRYYTLSIALISAGVSFVIILAIVIGIVLTRRYIQRDRDTSTFGAQLAVSAVMGHAPDTDTVSVHAGTVDNDSNAGSVFVHAGTDDNDSNAGPVPGRGGTDDDDSYACSVHGRGGTVDNDSYLRSVPGRGGTVDDDSFGGEVHGRTASGHINLY